MNKTNTIYVDDKGKMIRDIRWLDEDGMHGKHAPKLKDATLLIIDMGWQNSGYYVKLLDEESGETYYMSRSKFEEYIKTYFDLRIHGNFGFYKQGTVYSIGLEE